VTQLLINSFIAGSTYALVGLGFTLIYCTTRFFHFAHGGLYALGAYLMLLFARLLELPVYLSALFAILLTALIGCAFDRVVYRPIRQRGAGPLACMLSSLGLLIIIQNVISLAAGEETRALRTGAVVEGIIVLDARITATQLTTMVVCTALYLLTLMTILYTRIGRTVRAVANDPHLARVVGIDSDRVVLFTFGTGSALAAVAGILVGYDTDLTPMMGFHALLMGVVAVIVGGVGSVPGAALGGLLVGIAQSFGVWKLPTQWQDAIVFVILILFLLFRPQGFLGKPLRSTTI
jgi:branched-chain amino acid transport system permease protein